jgi:hypothetical protein
MKAGKPLGDFVQRKFYRGLLTGLNEAFSITSEQRQEIVKKSPESASLIKPFLGGEDIRRYYIEDDGKLMIVIPCGWTKGEIAKTKKGSVSEKQAWEWLKQNHAGIADHLESFEDALRKRQDQGDYFWELRPCDYYSSLDAPKIIFPDICKAPRFCVDRSGIYLANTAYCLGTDSLYLLGLLNSRLFWFAIANISIPFGTRAGEYRYRLIYQYMERVPVRPIDDEARLEPHASSDLTAPRRAGRGWADHDPARGQIQVPSPGHRPAEDHRGALVDQESGAQRSRTVRLVVTSVLVDDQDKALRFYTDVLGFVKKTEVPLGAHRWLTVVSPDEPDGVELVLEPDEHPAAKPFLEKASADSHVELKITGRRPWDITDLKTPISTHGKPTPACYHSLIASWSPAY